MSIQDLNDTLELALREPLTLGTLSFESVTLREPTGEILKLADREGLMGGLILKISRTARVSPAVPKRMRQRDLQTAADFFATFDKADDDEAFGDDLVLTLMEPIELPKRTVTELSLSEPTGEALQRADQHAGWAETCALVECMADVGQEVTGKMRQRDLQRARRFFAHFSKAALQQNSATSQPS